MTGTMTIVLLAGILMVAAMVCRLGKRPGGGASRLPDPSTGFRDPLR